MHVAYVALDDEGREVSGTAEAPDVASAVALLRARGLFPVELAEGAARLSAARGDGTGWSLPGLVRGADVRLLCEQLALMLRTGLTLLQALDVLALRLERPALRRAARRLSDAVQQGAPLSRALAAEGRLLPPVLVQLVKTAEATGELDQAFTRGAEYLARRAALRAQLVTSLIYPAIVVLAAAGVFWFLTVEVVPKFARFLAARRVALPWTTQQLMDLSDFLRTYGLHLAGGAGVLLAALLVLYRTRPGREALDRTLLALPVVGGVVRSAALAHLSRTLALLLRSGQPLLESLRLVGESFQNRTYALVLLKAEERVAQGASLADALQGPGISALTTQVLAVGEQTGALDHVLEELSGFYDQRLQQRIRTLAALVEPALLLLVGGMVGFVYFSFFQAIFQLASR